MLHLKVQWDQADLGQTWETETTIAGYKNEVVEQYFKDHNLSTEVEQKAQLNGRKIAEILGLFPNSNSNDLVYVVRPENETNYIIVSSNEIQQSDPQKLIDFLESHLILDNHIM